MVVAVGVTLTASPLLTERLPGVMTPVPLANTPVSVMLAPVVMVAVLAVKLVMEAGGVWIELLDEPQPEKLVRQRRRTQAPANETAERFMGLFPKSN